MALDFTRRGLMKTGYVAATVLATKASIVSAQSGEGQKTMVSPGDSGWQEITPDLTDYISGAATHTVPAAIRERARLHILDTLASIIACNSLEAATLGRAYAAAMSPDGQSPILGSRQAASPVDAVFASAMTAHAAEINDFIQKVTMNIAINLN